MIGLMPRALSALIEINCAEKIAMVGERQSRHTGLARRIQYIIEAIRAVKETVLAV